MSPSSSNLLETATSFILCIPGLLPFFYFSQTRLLGPSGRPKRAPVICIFVSLLGPLAAVSAAFGITALTVEKYRRTFEVVHAITQCFLEFAYRVPILYVMMPRSFVIAASQVKLPRGQLNWHGILFTSIMLTTFILGVVHISLVPSPFPDLLVLTLNILAAVYPIPFLMSMAILTQKKRVRRVWIFIIILQSFSTVSGSLRIPRGPIYSMCAAIFTALWGGSVITLFYTFCFSPLPEYASPFHLRLCTLPSPLPAPLTPQRVYYEAPNPRSSSGGIISEDFTALRDPFASPTSISPASKRMRPLSSSPLTPPSSPPVVQHQYQTPTSTSRSSIRRSQVVSRQSMRTSRPLRLPPPRTSSRGRTGGTVLSHNTMRSENSEVHHDRDSNEDSFFLNTEVLLSQILLDSLTAEVASSKSVAKTEISRQRRAASYGPHPLPVSAGSRQDQPCSSRPAAEQNCDQSDVLTSTCSMNTNNPEGRMDNVSLESSTTILRTDSNNLLLTDSGKNVKEFEKKTGSAVESKQRAVLQKKKRHQTNQTSSTTSTNTGTSAKAWWNKRYDI